MKKLRSGHTTGACAGAASKGTAIALKTRKSVNVVDSPFPDDHRVSFEIFSTQIYSDSVVASDIKDAGDDPDVTNGATISASLSFIAGEKYHSEFFC